MRVTMMLTLLAAMAGDGAAAAELKLKVYPDRPLIEQTRFGQALNFDIELENLLPQEIELTAIRAAVRDETGAIIQRLEVNDNGGAPGINTVPHRNWKPKELHTIYNPFHTLSRDISIGRIDYEFAFRTADKKTLTQSLTVRPHKYRTKTRLTVPLPGRVLVWDGHDFYSHHRRWDFSHPAVKKLGLLTNPGRYSFDLVVVDSDGRFFTGNGEKREDYFSFGQPVVAPAAGTVVAAHGQSSNEPAEPRVADFQKDPMRAVYGNYVVIDHGNGEYSQLGHLKQGTVIARVGDKVRAGQKLGEAGASGSSLFPHLHYQLTNGPGVEAEGLPAYFQDAVRVLGRKRTTKGSVWIDSGDIVETSIR